LNLLQITTIFLLGLLSCNTPAPANIQPNTLIVDNTQSYCGLIEEDDYIVASSRRQKQVATQSRQAAVEVHNDGRGVRGSGTYFIYDGNPIIVTSAHVVEGPSPIVTITSPSGESVPAMVAYFNLGPSSDYAVLVLAKEMKTRTAMDFEIRRSYNDIIGESIVYTGFPGAHDQLTLYGNVIGIARNGDLLLHSYAWMGASGSVIFDDRGRILGVLKAVDVNRTPTSPFRQVTEDIVWISRFDPKLDKLDKVLLIMQLIEELNTGE
tara:strand:+ start:1020 stop:1814 length:795 start_codon:yes stop_codon:yes gene_type:complete